MNVIKDRKKIEIINDSGQRLPLKHDEARNIILHLLSYYQISGYLLNIVTVEDDYLRNMKKTYFGEDVYTDIISFTMDCSEDFLEGELYISPVRIRENAAAFQSTLRQEFARILIHGFLHLMGYDDQTDEEKSNMKRLEDRFLKECGYA